MGSIIFNVDPAQSSLRATGSINGDALSTQTTGSDLANYSGTMEVDLTAGAIQFLGGTVTAGNFASALEPSAGGGSGSASANYGHWVSTTLFGYLAASGNSAIRGLNLTLDSIDTGPIALSTLDAATQGFDARNIGVNANSFSVDWLLSGHAASPSVSNKYWYDQNSAGTLATVDGIQTLTIPVTVSYRYNSYQTNDSLLGLSGTLVATHLVPEPAGVSLIVLSATMLLRRRHTHA
jgi:hypothetical protein